MVRGLEHRQLGIAQHPANRHLQKTARRYVIAIEDGYERRGHALQRRIDVARLCMEVVGADLIAAAGLERKLLKFFAPAVVENIDVELVGGPIHV